MNFNSKYKALLASVCAVLFTNLLHLWIDHDIDDTKYDKSFSKLSIFHEQEAFAVAALTTS